VGQAEAAALPISSYIFVQASAQLPAITPPVHWLEHLDIAGAISPSHAAPFSSRYESAQHRSSFSAESMQIQFPAPQWMRMLSPLLGPKTEISISLGVGG
jgi:hypothetical protein